MSTKIFSETHIKTSGIEVASLKPRLKVESFKFDNDKNMIASTHRTNTKMFTFIAVLVFMLLSPNVLFINRKDNTNC